MQSRPNDIFITGGRGRLAGLIAEEWADGTRGKVRLFSRAGGGEMTALDELFRPAGLSGAGVVLHLAWSCLPVVAEQMPALVEAEDLPLLNRLLVAVESVPPGQRPHIIFFSSGGTVYGNAAGRPSEEGDECRPLGAYGRGKLMAEEAIRRWAVRTGGRYTILRISNPYGYGVPAERPQGIIPHAIKAARDGTPLTLWGDGSAQKDFLHYTDFLRALQAIMALKPVGTFNVSRGESHSLGEVLAEVERQTGRRIERRHTDAATWDVQDSRLANGRLREATGWRPEIGLAEGIRRSLKARG